MVKAEGAPTGAPLKEVHVREFLGHNNYVECESPRALIDRTGQQVALQCLLKCPGLFVKLPWLI